jgi:hypothetical protein
MVVELNLVLGTHAAEHDAVGNINKAIDAAEASLLTLHAVEIAQGGEAGKGLS